MYCLNNPLKYIDPDGRQTSLSPDMTEMEVYYFLVGAVPPDRAPELPDHRTRMGALSTMSLITGGAGIVAMCIPGGQGAGLYLLGTSTGITVVKGGAETVHYLQTGDSESGKAAIVDVVSVMAGAGARAIAKELQAAGALTDLSLDQAEVLVRAALSAPAAGASEGQDTAGNKSKDSRTITESERDRQKENARSELYNRRKKEERN